MKKKEKRGGVRKGAGRPKKEDTVVMRIPVSKIDEVKKIISHNMKTKKFATMTNSGASIKCLKCIYTTDCLPQIRTHLNQQRKDDQ